MREPISFPIQGTVFHLNKAYEGFIGRFGVEPNGLLVHEDTFQTLKQNMATITNIVADDALITFRGMTIYRAAQMPINQVKFVL